MPEIHVGLIEKAHLTQIEIGNPQPGNIYRKLRLSIPKSPIILDYERKQSPYFWLEAVQRLQSTGETSFASHENPLLTPCAGAVSVFENESGEPTYVSFSQKDASAPRDPGFRVPRNGFPSSEEDWWTMDHLYREAFEEGIFVTRDGMELLLPEDERFDEIINSVAEMLSRKTGLRINGTKRAKIRFENGKDTIEIYRGDPNRTKVYKGVLSITPETGINFIQVMRVGYPIEDLYLIDGETLPDGTPIGRNTCVINLKELQGKKFGDVIEETVQGYEAGKVRIYNRREPFLTDKVPRSVLNQIIINGAPIYPIDWMEESFEFLSNPRVLRDFTRFGWSALEKKLKVTS